MLFNSIDFAIFLPIVFWGYWLVSKYGIRAQNILLLVASYIFYGAWDWRFLSLIALSSGIDYFVGISLGKTRTEAKRKLLLTLSLSVNIGLLLVFKYYNFFLESFTRAFSLLGYSINAQELNLILPIGISFYTFQTLSYSIDVYRRKIKPTKDAVIFFTFVSFFPQLVAGPIERATNLLPQFYSKRIFESEKAIDGTRQILWGLFKKIVIADNCAIYVNQTFSHHADYSGSTLLLGALLFSFQIYGDFSGYSDIAIGTSRLFGFEMMRNFAFPYFSRDIAEFWRRWHISLSTWFRDYIYIPLGGSRGSTAIKVRNILAVFMISGLWHGANWTFLVWGALHVLYFLPLMLMSKNRQYTGSIAENRFFPTFREVTQMGMTFTLTSIAWVFFRAESVGIALDYIQSIFSTSLFQAIEVVPIEALCFVAILIVVEWIQRDKQHALQINTAVIPSVIRWPIYYGVIFCILLFGGSQQDFIYFQF